MYIFILPADVGLFEVWSHADCLSVELIGLLQPRLVGSDQIGQVYVNVEMVGGHPRGVLLTRNDLKRMDNTRASCLPHYMTLMVVSPKRT